MRRIHRELSAQETARHNTVATAARTLIQAVLSGEVELDSLPSDVRDGLTQVIQEDPTAEFNDDDWDRED
jgi:hypothetical protein